MDQRVGVHAVTVHFAEPVAVVIEHSRAFINHRVTVLVDAVSRLGRPWKYRRGTVVAVNIGGEPVTVGIIVRTVGKAIPIGVCRAVVQQTVRPGTTL